MDVVDRTMKNNLKRIGRSFYLLLGSLLANLQNLRFIGYGMLHNSDDNLHPVLTTFIFILMRKLVLLFLEFGTFL